MDAVIGQLDNNYKIKFERGVNGDKVPYISIEHIDPLGNPVWGETCFKDIKPEKFAELEEAMERAIQ